MRHGVAVGLACLTLAMVAYGAPELDSMIENAEAQGIQSTENGRPRGARCEAMRREPQLTADTFKGLSIKIDTSCATTLNYSTVRPGPRDRADLGFACAPSTLAAEPRAG